MVASQKFLDLRSIATSMGVSVTEGDGSMLDTVLTHQGAIKVVTAGLAVMLLRKTKIGKSELFKLLALGIMIQGSLQEINVLTGGTDYQIGDAELNKAMEEAAAEIKKNLSGNENGRYTYLGENPTTMYTPSVGANPTTMYTPQVGSRSNTFEDGTGVGYPDIFND